MAVQNDPIVGQSINVGSVDLIRTVEAGVVPALKLNICWYSNSFEYLTYIVRGNSKNSSFYVV